MLDAGELAAYASRDVLRGRRVMSPVEATVSGIARDGGLQLRLGDGALRTIRTGEVRLAFAEPADETPGR
jgi:biotin-(acetyl-CoA carboxylase) ligase